MKNENKYRILVTFKLLKPLRAKTSTKRKLDMRRKNKSNTIHRKANLRAKKSFKREITLRKKPKCNTSRTKRKVDLRRW